MNDRAGFLNAILAAPADDTVRMGYADWLREQPGAFDQLHGRFLWAGLTLAQFRGQDVVEDGMFFDALRDQNDAASTVLAAQLRHLLGWDRLTTEWAWDNETSAPDRIHVVTIPPKTEGETRNERRERRRNPVLTPTVTYERGCVTALRLAAAQWASAGPSILRQCPLERVEFLEVPGLVLRIVNRNGWRVVGELRPPRPRQSESPGGSPTTTSVTEAEQPLPIEPGCSREQLIENLTHSTALILTRLHDLTGFAWPGPLPETLLAPGPHIENAPTNVNEALEGI